MTRIHIAVDGVEVGCLALTDEIKDTTEEAVHTLHEQGITIVMATGDAEGPAKAVAQTLGIDEFRAGVKPDDKQRIVEELHNRGNLVAMAGDGINDAPALAQADIGIAMGTGSDIAIDAAQVTLVKGDLRGIAAARRVSDATVRNMKENLTFAFLYNTIGIPITAQRKEIRTMRGDDLLRQVRHGRIVAGHPDLFGHGDRAFVMGDHHLQPQSVEGVPGGPAQVLHLS